MIEVIREPYVARSPENRPQIPDNFTRRESRTLKGGREKYLKNVYATLSAFSNWFLLLIEKKVEKAQSSSGK